MDDLYAVRSERVPDICGPGLGRGLVLVIEHQHCMDGLGRGDLLLRGFLWVRADGLGYACIPRRELPHWRVAAPARTALNNGPQPFGLHRADGLDPVTEAA